VKRLSACPPTLILIAAVVNAIGGGPGDRHDVSSPSSDEAAYGRSIYIRNARAWHEPTPDKEKWMKANVL
jgi:hypothetical protein